MRRVLYLIHASLDGFVAGANGEIDWVLYDGELEKYSHDLTRTVDTNLYGRVTYQMMEGFWPTVPGNPSSSPSEVEYALWLNQATKVVFSRTLDKVVWEHSLLIQDNIGEALTTLKQQPGKDMLLIGSASIGHELTRLNLIDEYRINVNPILLGKGMPLFRNVEQVKRLKLLEARRFQCGVVGLRYEPDRS